MVVDRIERHDIINALMLAGILLLLGIGVITATRSLFSTVDEGLVIAEKEPVLESGEVPAGATAASVPDTTTEDPTTTFVEARPAEEVTVRVANGARRAGVAAAGTEAVQSAGYPTLSPKNGPTVDDSVVYYANGFAADAVQVATVLGLESDQIAPMPADPGVPIDDAQVIAILGVNSDF
ncbi:MAG: LytR C-terminal domain-containing protein [Acidimicrobiales bacterium]